MAENLSSRCVYGTGTVFDYDDGDDFVKASLL